MTIEGINKYGMAATEETAMCVWFEANKGQQVKKQDHFALHMLTKG